MSKTLGNRTTAGVAAVVIVAVSGLGMTAAAGEGATPPTCRGRTATIVGTAGSNEIRGTSGPDVIVGRGGSDDIEGRGGDDWICGNGGNDELEGAGGNDHLYGGAGHDEAEGGPGSDVCVAEEKEGC